MSKELTPIELFSRAIAKPEEERDYLDRMYIWCHNRDNMLETEGVEKCLPYDEGEEVCIYDKYEILKDGSKTLAGEEYPDFIKEAAEHFGERVKIQFEEDKEYILIGISYTYLDWYYILERPDKTRVHNTCVSGITYCV